MTANSSTTSDITAASSVYFTTLGLKTGQTLLTKLRDLAVAAGIKDIDFDRKYTAIKMHFGEQGNLAYLRPNYAKVIVDLVRELGGRPFLVDCNTLYPGRRKNALEHLDLAYEHGFSPFSTGCHVIIGDGLAGTDEVLVPVEGGTYIKEAKIGQAVMDADIIISLNHFKGHIETGFGGALKNIGMGCGSRAGKMEMHSASEPKVRQETCIGCGKCARYCANDAISFKEKKASIYAEKCVGCGHCIGACPTDSIYSDFDEKNELLDAKIAEYTKAVLHGRPSFHISMVIDVSPFCDCWQGNDIPIVADVGMFASFDPVALDVACANAVNAQPVSAGSKLEEGLDKLASEHAHDRLGQDYFHALFPNTNWKAQVDYAEKLGLGKKSYTLIEV
ncbi:MAG: DUF362 domain-containing protein [Coriobacteriales bacterium]|jgi:uncharacterized Fe-S center protein|nr:DUF362 domain-containing protein [Coriobacteriales bacterium]